MKVEILRAEGARYEQELPRDRSLIAGISQLIGADTLDTVNLRDGRVMLIDDMGHPKGLPRNEAATELYHSVCRPGTTHWIAGDAVICWDEDFAGDQL